MKYAKLLSLVGAFAMAAVIVHGFARGDFFSEGSWLVHSPWGLVSLVDLYTGFALFSCWIIYRERSLPVAILWTIAMMALGFFAGSVYTFLALQASGNDWRRFWLGKHAQ